MQKKKKVSLTRERSSEQQGSKLIYANDSALLL